MVECMWTTCCNAMSNAAADSRAIRRLRPKHRRVHGWAADLHHLHTTAARLHRRYRRARASNNSQCEELRVEWRAAEHEFRRTFTATKRASWDSLCDAITDPSNCRLYWAAFNKTRPSTASLVDRVRPAEDARPAMPAAAAVAAADDSKHDGGDGGARSSSSPSPITSGLETLTRHFAAACTLPADPRDDLLLARCGNGESDPPPTEAPDARPRGSTYHLRPPDFRDICNAPITRDDVRDACESVSLTGAYGPDDIPQHFLRYAAPPLIDALHVTADYSFNHGVLPLDWRSANVAAVPKGDSAELALPSGYRPISVTSIFARCIERILLPRIRRIMEPQLHSSQHGFRRGRGTAAPLYTIYSALLNHTARNGSRHAVAFIDIKSAFDRVWHAAVLYKLHRFGIVGKLWRWIRAFLTGRRMRVVHRGQCSDWVILTAGVPQGSVASPNYYIAFINDLPATCPVEDILWELYADDIALLALLADRIKSIRAAAAATDAKLIQALHHVTAFLNEWRGTANVTKSAILLCSQPRAGPRVSLRKAPARVAYPRDAPAALYGDSARRWCQDEEAKVGKRTAVFKLGGLHMPIVDSYKYLGVVFHYTLHWSAHCDYLTQKLASTNRLITRIIRPWDGPRTPVIRQLVLTLILPVIAYGAHIWLPDTATCHTNGVLSQLALCLSRSLGFTAGSHVHRLSVLAECGVPDLTAIGDRALVAFVRSTLGSNTQPAHALLRAHLIAGRTNSIAPDAILGRRCIDALQRLAHHLPLLMPHSAHADFSDPSIRWCDISAKQLTRAATTSSYRRWLAAGTLPDARCRDLIGWRSRYPTSLFVHPRGRAAAAAAAGGDGGGGGGGNGGDGGIALYLLHFSKPAAVAIARLRFNRNDTANSRHRRGRPPLCFINDGGDDGSDDELPGLCHRNSVCHAQGLVDTVAHFIAICPGPEPHQPLDRIRHMLPFRSLPFHDTAAMLGERFIDDQREHDQHYQALARFWDTMRQCCDTI